ncbi:DUF4382 domain-containing protein [Marinoscillum sp. MHG1-6]|uniref:DUF4382 domain-containing protein n=1 Tax=Marinoscillum sp. MHG1-6 TaxID=2959627 RepID=UPI0021587C3A|nr:DUF4382 domain-containing protein [Marinoscillum sp. MHG1-6]
MHYSKVSTSIWIIAALAGSLLLAACNDDVESKGQVSVSVTDAAVDAENISGVYLSVTEVQAKSESGISTVARFDEPKEFNVMAYQNGEVFDLGDGELAAGIYSELRLILSEGGSYVTYEDGSSVNMEVPSGTTTGYKIKGDFQISANNETDLVIDIDLRKTLVTSGINENEYLLRPTARLIIGPNTGTITGSVEVDTASNDRLVVYAYAEGTFDSSEADAPAEGEARFDNSINSAIVAKDGSFTLAFMEEGDYELIFSNYTMNEVENSYDYEAMIAANLSINGILLNDLVTVEANSTTMLLVNLNL